MPYFDPSNAADKNLLHADVRDHAELANVAGQIEHEVIEHYREEYPRFPQTGYRSSTFDPDGPLVTRVFLHGYDEDPAEAEANFKEALRRTIAELVSFALRVYDNEIGIQSKRRGGRSESYAGRIPTKDEWPGGWDHRLILYDNTEVVYGL